MKSCNFNGNLIPVNEIGDDEIEQGKAYDLTEYGNDGVFVHAVDGGSGTFDTDEEGSITVVGDSLLLVNEEPKTKSHSDNLVFLAKAASITSADIASKKKKNAVENAETAVTTRKKGSSKRIAGHEKLSLELNDDDDLLVQLVKTNLNKGHITLEQVYDACDDNSTGYNMFYGLKTRKTMTVESFERWMEILGCDFEIVITVKVPETTVIESE